jgi:PEP-CTERM motif
MVRSVLWAVAALLAITPGLAWADNLTIQDPGLQIFQQTQNSPCVIGENSCKQPATMDLKVSGGLIPENTSPYDVTATYTVQTILDVLAANGNGATAFTLGIDVNTAQGQPIEILQLFTMDVLGVNNTGATCATGVEFCFGDPDHTFFLTNNGTGFSDSLLFGFNLAGFDPSAIVAFHAIVDRATDGREQFFIIPAGTTPIPEPATLFLVGSGLVGIGAWGRKRFLRTATS